MTHSPSLSSTARQFLKCNLENFEKSYSGTNKTCEQEDDFTEIFCVSDVVIKQTELLNSMKISKLSEMGL